MLNMPQQNEITYKFSLSLQKVHKVAARGSIQLNTRDILTQKQNFGHRHHSLDNK